MSTAATATKTAFTPAPWKIDLDASETATLVAEVGSWWITGPGEYELEAEEEDANARLILAAPELYQTTVEALPVIREYRDSIVERHSAHGVLDEEIEDEIAPLDSLIRRIEVALSKAEAPQ